MRSVSWDNTVGTQTCHWLDVLVIKSQYGQDFLHPSKTALGHIQPPIQWVSFLGAKQTSSTKVKVRVEL